MTHRLVIPGRIHIEDESAGEAVTLQLRTLDRSLDVRQENIPVRIASQGLGIDRARIAAAGFGASRPLLPTGRRGRPDPRDARIELVVVAAGGSD